MPNNRGVVVNFEGGDGSGKGTQSRMTYENLINLGVRAKLDGFPRYQTPTGKKIAAYLNYEMGPNVDPRIAGQLYTDDREAFKPEMMEWLNKGGSWILDRYSDSNMHQAGKIPDREGRIKYIQENHDNEYVKLGMPIPDMTILLTLPPEIAQTYIDQKMARSYTALKRDMHEDDPNHLRNANEAFLLFAELNPDRVRIIDNFDSNGERRSPEAVNRDVMAAIRPLLEREGLLRAA
jgi:dTMP kinase